MKYTLALLALTGALAAPSVKREQIAAPGRKVEGHVNLPGFEPNADGMVAAPGRKIEGHVNLPGFEPNADGMVAAPGVGPKVKKADPPKAAPGVVDPPKAAPGVFPTSSQLQLERTDKCVTVADEDRHDIAAPLKLARCALSAQDNRQEGADNLASQGWYRDTYAGYPVIRLWSMRTDDTAMCLAENADHVAVNAPCDGSPESIRETTVEHRWNGEVCLHEQNVCLSAVQPADGEAHLVWSDREDDWARFEFPAFNLA